ncbi:unnamed protein product [Phytophthora lilii]|uniref:beta-glucosidase n=1 Tax=Phytophthora lilii TaxID=2077276 RepID=A0A9W6X5J3_9STRA|nr:unnamed protein product [Phytophthora lilii]
MTQERQFPARFIWGASTAAYQIEGGAQEGGRGPSIWDAFVHTPGKTYKGQTGDVAIDHFHRYKEDVALMKQIGLKAYRFSLSWSRIIPAGVGAVNEEGVDFYNRLIDELLANDITPFVTLYHWDLPLVLQTEFDGWLGVGTQVSDAFVAYARVCFQRFGVRVKNWITLNEPWVHSIMGLALGVHAPGRKHNAHTEPYRCGHNLLIAHSRAVDVYRKEFQELQGGQIGITLSADWRLPGPTDDPAEMKENIAAAERSIAFHLGWFADPVYKGDYPQIMKDRLGDRLPKFTKEQQQLLKGSSDFFGLNNYSSSYAKPADSYKPGELPPSDSTGSFFQDEGVNAFEDPSWEQTAAMWNFVTPWGLKALCLHISKTYQPKNGIIITENGSSWPDQSKEEGIKDVKRIDFYEQYLTGVHEAISEGADVRGYFTWSLFDNYEWAGGFNIRFGLVWVDFDTLERTPKVSSVWYYDTIVKNGFRSKYAGIDVASP